MIYVVALGNPGKEYDGTRHNVGWYIADALRAEYNFSEPVVSKKNLARVCVGNIGGQAVTLIYPETFMNHSGNAVAKVVPKEEISSLIVLQDEIALPIGAFKLSSGRGDGGHNGIRSIVNVIGTSDFVRIRIGIAPTGFFTGKIKPVSGEDRAKFVLGRFSLREQKALANCQADIMAAIVTCIEKGSTAAMNTYN